MAARQNKPIAVYPMTAGFGIEIMAVDFGGITPTVQWKWTNETRVRTSTVKEAVGGARFRAGRQWISLGECMSV